MLQKTKLCELIRQRTAAALQCGALQTIETRQKFIEDRGIRFCVRTLSSLEEKARLKEKASASHRGGTRPVNPFLPYDKDLFVVNVGDSHVCLLNKFNVIPHHILIVTRDFEFQESPLAIADFKALDRCQASLQGLCFYNSGTAAGASQQHKHLQIVPLPLAAPGPDVPIDPWIDALGTTASAHGIVTSIAEFPFENAFVRLDTPLGKSTSTLAQTWNFYYRSMLAASGIAVVDTGDGLRTDKPYNLIITRRWMLVVPRSQESHQGISINALGYAGSMFVRDEHALEIIETSGPMQILRHVACKR